MTQRDGTAILIADDHPIYRMGLREAIEADGRFRVVAEAADGDEALRLLKERGARVAVLDMKMPKMNGLAVVGEIHRLELPVSVIMLTMYDDENIFNKAMELGVAGYLLKDSASTDIIRAIECVSRGACYISPVLSDALVRNTSQKETKMQERSRLEMLTRSERQILESIASMKPTREIAEALNISPRTVEKHRAHICDKLELSGSFSLLRFAIEHRKALEEG
jgi:DNA-binding NarL/FixJ family response regulator